MKLKIGFDASKAIQGFKRLEPITPEQEVAEIESQLAAWVGTGFVPPSMLDSPEVERYRRHEENLARLKLEYDVTLGMAAPTNPIGHNKLVREAGLFRNRYGHSPKRLFLQSIQAEFLKFDLTQGGQNYNAPYNPNRGEHFAGAKIIGVRSLPNPELIRYIYHHKLPLYPWLERVSVRHEFDIEPGAFPDQGILFALEDETLIEAIARVGGNAGLDGLQYLESRDEAKAVKFYGAIDQNLLSMMILGDVDMFKLLEQYQKARGLMKLRAVEMLIDMLADAV